MKHPSREDLIAYLYAELAREPRAELEQHLHTCAACRANLAAWRQAARHLDAFKTSDPRRASPAWPPLARWGVAAAAAAVVLLGGFALGRLTGISRAELEAARRDAARQAVAVSRTETQELLQQFAGGILDRLNTLETQQTHDYATLRKELETVAVLTEASFRQTENRLGRLASNVPQPISQPSP
jgi:hypothetical protein